MTAAVALTLTLLAAWYVVTRRWKHIADLDAPGTIYLSRLFLVKTPFLGVYLHIIRRPDYARCVHDHPWPFATLILWGGYEEEVLVGHGVSAAGDVHLRASALFTRRPGYLGIRRKSFEHRITRLLRAVAVTLVVRGIDGIEWGFRAKDGRKMSWREYCAAPGAVRILWCSDE